MQSCDLQPIRPQVCFCGFMLTLHHLETALFCGSRTRRGMHVSRTVSEYNRTSLMCTPLGPTRRVRNIEASVFQRLPVIFPVGVAISIRHAMARFVATCTKPMSENGRHTLVGASLSEPHTSHVSGAFSLNV